MHRRRLASMHTVLYKRGLVRSSLHRSFGSTSPSGTLEEAIFASIGGLSFPTEPFRVFLSVSGGSDSMAMLHIFARLKREKLSRMSLSVVNFNHKLRSESDEEAELVAETCRSLDIPCSVVEAQEGQFVKSVQTTARQWRRSYFATVLAQQSTPSFVATAHTLDDQAETLLLKFFRGVHISNIQPMKVRDGYYIRPLSAVPKADLRDFLIDHGLQWREDASNLDSKYTRNYLRNEVVPALARLSGSETALRDRLFHLAEQSADLNDWIASESRQLKETAEVSEYPGDEYPHVLDLSRGDRSLLLNRLVVGHVVNEWMVDCIGEAVAYPLLRAVVSAVQSAAPPDQEPSTFRVTLNKLWDVVVIQRQVRLQRSVAVSVPSKRALICLDACGKSLQIEGPEFVSVEASAAPVEVTDGWLVVLDQAQLCARAAASESVRLAVRFAREGDKWGHRSLSSALRKMGVPAERRDRVLVLTESVASQKNGKPLILCVLEESGRVLTHTKSSELGEDFKGIRLVVKLNRRLNKK